MALLDIQSLSIHYHVKGEPLHAVQEVSLTLDRGEMVGIVGESGCGKSTLSHAILQLLPANASFANGKILWEGTDLLTQSPHALRQIRGKEIAMIFQDPFMSLNPVLTVGEQIAEVFMEHEGMKKRVALEQAVRELDQVHIPDPRERVHSYPHELSGGMRQRVMIAMALALKPKLLIADEPTTALDVTTQLEILKLLLERQQATQLAILFITHNLSIVAELCQRVYVMYAGQIAETGNVDTIFLQPAHPYTQGLLASLPDPEHGFPKGIPGRPPFLYEALPGCPYEPRCPIRIADCQSTHPELRHTSQGQLARCIRV